MKSISIRLLMSQYSVATEKEKTEVRGAEEKSLKEDLFGDGTSRFDERPSRWPSPSGSFFVTSTNRFCSQWLLDLLEGEASADCDCVMGLEEPRGISSCKLLTGLRSDCTAETKGAC